MKASGAYLVSTFQRCKRHFIHANRTLVLHTLLDYGATKSYEIPTTRSTDQFVLPTDMRGIPMSHGTVSVSKRAADLVARHWHHRHNVKPRLAWHGGSLWKRNDAKGVWNEVKPRVWKDGFYLLRRVNANKMKEKK